MSLRHFRSLLFKSSRLQQEIDKEQRRRWPDWMKLLKMKKLRLAIKDRMQNMLAKRRLPHGMLRYEPVSLTTKRRPYPEKA